MRKLYVVCLLVFVFTRSGAQFYEYGQEPPTVQWKYIETENFKIIYPSGFDNKAEHVLGILDRYYLLNSEQLKHQPAKIPVILHSHSIRSNGLVVWAPKRMEFFMYPDINTISQDWYTHLSLHEFRHVVQIDKLDQGATGVLKYIVGQMGVGPAAGMLTFWFLEGDAVYAETSLSESGRGRLPEFEMKIKAQLLSDEKLWSLSKSYLGSYRDFVPDYYSLGYQMVSFARKNYGEEIWTDALNFVGRKTYMIDPLQIFLKKSTGGGKLSLYKNTMSYLKNHWEEQATKREIDSTEALNPSDHKFFTSYRSPRIAQDSSVIAVKSGFDIIDRFVKIHSDGREELLHIPGILNSGKIDFKGNKILWDEYVPGLRWINQSYSELRIFDIETGKVEKLSNLSRYSSPSFSPSGDTIVTVEADLSNDFYIVFLSPDGRFLDRVQAAKYLQLQDPAWIDNSDKIALISIDTEGKKIITYDRKTGRWDLLFDAKYYNINSPVSAGKYVLFNGTFTGIDEIYAIHIESKKLYKLSSSEVGAFHPDIVNDNFVYSWYTTKGYNISVNNLIEDSLSQFVIPEKITEQPFFSYGDSVFIPEDNIELTPNKDFENGKYNKLANLFNVHSWAPLWVDYNNLNLGEIPVNPGLTFFSQNLLSTAVSYAGYEFNDGDHYMHAGFTYKGWTPVFDLSVSWGGNTIVNQYNNQQPPETVKNLRYDLLGYIPLRNISGRWIMGAQPSLNLSYSRNYYYYTDTRSYRSGMVLMEPRLYTYFYQRSAYLDILPRWGIIMSINSISTPFEDEQFGSAYSLKSAFFLPGIIRSHGIRLRGELQEQAPERYLFNNLVSFPRGYQGLTSGSMKKFTADYMLPLAYPDFDFFGLFYLKRIRTSLFTDYVHGNNVYLPTENGYDRINGDFLTLGAELLFDFHPFRSLAPLTGGIRFNYLDYYNKVVIESIFSIDLGF